LFVINKALHEFDIDSRVSKSRDESIDRKQGSTHLPQFPRVSMRKPAEYSRTLNMNDVPKIRLVQLIFLYIISSYSSKNPDHSSEIVIMLKLVIKLKKITNAHTMISIVCN
jgi:hypothetical protein